MHIALILVVISLAWFLTGWSIGRSTLITKLKKKGNHQPSKADGFKHITATTSKSLILYDIAAAAANHEVDVLPAGVKVVLKEVKHMPDGRWYLIEFGSKTGYCQHNSLIL